MRPEWEHKTITVIGEQDERTKDQLNAKLTFEGTDGWELVSVTLALEGIPGCTRTHSSSNARKNILDLLCCGHSGPLTVRSRGHSASVAIVSGSVSLYACRKTMGPSRQHSDSVAEFVAGQFCCSAS
jgi:hypothetical protein